MIILAGLSLAFAMLCGTPSGINTYVPGVARMVWSPTCHWHSPSST